MRAFVIGLSHKTAPLELRGKVAFAPQQGREALRRLKARFPDSGFVLLSTCNRVELYGSAPEVFSPSACFDVLLEGRDVDIGAVRSASYVLEAEEAVRHLFRVSAALDSMVLGEDQILGQVKDSLDWARDAQAADLYLDVVFRYAITAAKRVKAETGMARHSLSLGVLAIKACEKELGNLRGKSALVIGSGKMGVLAARNLTQAGALVRMTRRTKHLREDPSAMSFPVVEEVSYDERHEWVNRSDIIVSATQCPFYTLKAEQVRAQGIGTRVFVDLAVPRDIDPGIAGLPGCALYDLDTLQQISLGNLELRQGEIEQAERIIAETLTDLKRWWAHRLAMPTLRRARAHIRRKYRDGEKVMFKKMRKNEIALLDPQVEAFLSAQFAALAEETLDTVFFRLREHCSPEELQVLYRCIDRAFRRW